MQAIPDQLAAEFGIPGSDIRKALNELAGVRAERMLPALIGVFLVQSTAAFVFSPAGDANILGWLAYGCAAGCSILWARLRRNSIESHQLQTIITLVGVSILIHTLVKLRLTSDSSQATVVIGALLVGSAFALSSWTHFVFLTTLSLSGWIAVARPQMASPELIYWSLALIMAASGSALRARRRLQAQSRLVEASLTQQVQQNAERLKQQHLQLAAEATNGAIWYWDLIGEVFQCSAAWETMFGYELKELGASVDAWFSRVHPAYLKALRENLAAHLEGGSAQFENEHRFLRKDGTYTWVLARGVAVRDEAYKRRMQNRPVNAA